MQSPGFSQRRKDAKPSLSLRLGLIDRQYLIRSHVIQDLPLAARPHNFNLLDIALAAEAEVEAEVAGAQITARAINLFDLRSLGVRPARRPRGRNDFDSRADAE